MSYICPSTWIKTVGEASTNKPSSECFEKQNLWLKQNPWYFYVSWEKTKQQRKGVGVWKKKKKAMNGLQCKSARISPIHVAKKKNQIKIEQIYRNWQWKGGLSKYLLNLYVVYIFEIFHAYEIRETFYV